MELVNGVDIFSTVVILGSVFLSYARGFLRECFTIAAWILSAIVSLRFGPSLVPILTQAPVLEEFFLGNCPLTMVVSFVLSFVISLTTFSLLITLFGPKSSLNNGLSILGTLDKMGGVLFGFGRSVIILIFLLICVQDIFPRSYFPNELGKAVDRSLSNKLLMPSKIFVKEEVSSNASSWLSETYELILKNECAKSA